MRASSPALIWGSTPAERELPFPCDRHLADPDGAYWRAIDIEAPAPLVFRWLCQLRVTPYSYDLLDNLGRPSARRIIPELQDLQPGDIVPMSPDGKQGMPVLSVQAPTSMVWGEPGGTTWAWQLDETGAGATRLLTRVRSRYQWFSPSITFSVLLEFGDIWMMRKMLLNLRERTAGAP